MAYFALKIFHTYWLNCTMVENLLSDDECVICENQTGEKGKFWKIYVFSAT